MKRWLVLGAVFAFAVTSLVSTGALARNNIRSAFFSTYPVAVGSKLDNLPSKTAHCGVCHYDFNGAGLRNPYGIGVGNGIAGGLTNQQAILAIQNVDSDGDGLTNLVEITDVTNYGNTPTFPGLSAANKGSTVNIPVIEIEPYLTPTGGIDTTPPAVTISSPNGGESIQADFYFTVIFSATDAGGISHINIFLSDDSGLTWKPVAMNLAQATGYSWFVPNRPGLANRLRVEAIDIAGNVGFDDSNADFTIIARPAGYVPTTLRDVDMPGTQPFEGAILEDPDVACATCHGNYDTANEPWYNWRGSMMAQAARDPFFYACMAVAEQDAPSVGDICIRCHTPGGWQEGRSVDTGGDLLTVKDRHGIHCDYCHRKVDWDYVPGVSPIEDVGVLANISPLPLQYANGQFINDPMPIRRGPYADVVASHPFVQSPFHRSADLCGTCHDVSNPAFNRISGADYAPNAFDAQHPDMNLRNMMPVERTFSEWSQSEYAATGVYAPQFAGNKPDGIVSTCQDCHMRDVNAAGSNVVGSPVRADLALHDMMGGNTFVPDIVDNFYPDEVSTAQLLAAKLRAEAMIAKAATLTLTPEDFGVTVRVTNETAHKLPSGYPEGRRIWLNVRAYDADNQVVFESGAYDLSTAVLTLDDQAKVYEVHPGLSPSLALALGMPAGPSFHFVLSDTIYSDNRIPPRGFTNAAFEQIQSPPVHHTYADGQYWDDTPYDLPSIAESVQVWMYYQSTSKEYIEFLRDANRTTADGQNLYNAWVGQGKAAPVLIAAAGAAVNVTTAVPGRDDEVPLIYALSQNYPNPFGPSTTVKYSIARTEQVRISVYDLSGRHVTGLVDEVQEPGRYSISWDGTNSRGEKVPAGVYFIRYTAGSHEFAKKAIVVR